MIFSRFFSIFSLFLSCFGSCLVVVWWWWRHKMSYPPHPAAFCACQSEFLVTEDRRRLIEIHTIFWHWPNGKLLPFRIDLNIDEFTSMMRPIDVTPYWILAYMACTFKHNPMHITCFWHKTMNITITNGYMQYEWTTIFTIFSKTVISHSERIPFRLQSSSSSNEISCHFDMVCLFQWMKINDIWHSKFTGIADNHFSNGSTIPASEKVNGMSSV